MRLTAENTAIVLDSTADLPDAAERFPNWRVVPLYVRFGDESLRDGVEIAAADFYAGLRESDVFPHDLATDAGRLPRLLPGARRVRARSLAPCLGARFRHLCERGGCCGRLEFLSRGGRIGKANRARRDAVAGQADPLHP